MDDSELRALDDPEFIAERRRLHEELSVCPGAVEREEYARIEAEFLRRSGMRRIPAGWRG